MPSEKATEIARQLSNDKGASGSQSVAEVAKALNAKAGKPTPVKVQLEGSKKGKK